jgi:4-amino-4-deoxy-L-arabinose transferase-like glycosyltransferase
VPSSTPTDLDDAPSGNDSERRSTPRPARAWAVSRRWLRARPNRWVLSAIAIGFALRTGWVLFATRPPVHLSDAWHYQEFARSFSYHSTMMIGGKPTAFYPPGYSFALAPLAWLSRKSGLFDLPMAASMLNVVAGTATVAAVAAVTRRWIGDRARNIAAWMMALAPAQIYLTSTSFAETFFTALFMIALWLITRAADRGSSLVAYGAIGLLVGYVTLVRSPGMLVLVAVPLVVRARVGRWRPSARPTIAVALGAVLVLAPWTIRNGVQVGVYTPMSTNNVAFLCIGNMPGAEAVAKQDAREAEQCFRGSVMDNPDLYQPGEVPPGWVFQPVDEPAWYRTTLTRAVDWVWHNPGEEPPLMAQRFYQTFNGDTQALSDAEGFGSQKLVSDGVRTMLNGLANVWLWAVLALAIGGLLLVPACRAARPIWSLVALQLLAVFAGPALHRFHHSIVALLVVLAAGALAGVPFGSRRDEPAADDVLPAGQSTE